MAGCLSVRLSVASGRCSVKTAKHIAQTTPRGRPGILVYLVPTTNIIGHRDTSTKTYLLIYLLLDSDWYFGPYVHPPHQKQFSADNAAL